MDEYLDLVDHNDAVIGKKLRSEVYKEGLSNFRVINAFVKNSRGELWIPRRGPNKRIYPNALDMSVGGHVESGEDYNFSFARETAEELNIDTAKTPWKFLGKCTPHEHGVSAFMRVYVIETDDAPNYNPNDFTEATWFTPQELRTKLENGVPTKGDLIKLLNIFFPDKT